MKNKIRNAFTLPELLVVVAILGVILPILFGIIRNTAVNFSTVYSLLETEKDIIRFKENFRLFCWKSYADATNGSPEFRKDGKPTETVNIIKGDNVYDNYVGGYSRLPTALQPSNTSVSDQRDTLFLPKGQTGVSGQWAMIRFTETTASDPNNKEKNHVIRWYPTASDSATPSLTLHNVYRPDYDPVTNPSTKTPIIYVALNPTTGLIDCVQIRCKIKIDQLFGKSRYILFITTARLNIVS